MPERTSDGQWKWGNVTRKTKKELAQTVYGIWKSNGSKGSFHDFYHYGKSKNTIKENYSFLNFKFLKENCCNEIEFLYPTLSELEKSYKCLDGAGEEDSFIKSVALPKIKKEMFRYVSEWDIGHENGIKRYMKIYKKLQSEYQRIVDTYGSKDEEDLGKLLDKEYFTSLVEKL